MMGYLRRVAALLLCAAMGLTLAACGREEESAVAYVEGPRFKVATADTPDSLNPVVSRGGLAEEFFLLAYDPLWRLDAAGQPTACLAEDWSLSSDRLTWTVRLRRDATFSDGTPVTAADVLFSYELMSHNDTPYSDYFEGISAIRQADDYTVVISTEYVKGDMLYNPTPILPRRLWKDYEFSPASFENAELVGSGPFVLVSAGEEGWLFRARADHFGGAAKVGEVFFARYGTVTGAARAVSAGEADASFGLTDVQLTTLESVPGVELIQAVLPGTVCMLLAMNTRTEIFSSEALRRAMELAADRAWFLSMAAGGAGMTGSSFFSPGLDSFIVPEGLRTYSPDTALGLLHAAGYADSDGDGFLDYGPRQTKLMLRLYSSSQDPWAATAATIITADLGEIGVQVDWRKTDQSAADACRADEGWDMCLVGWSCSPDAAVTAARFRAELGSLTGWEDPAYDGDLALLRAAEEPSVALGYARRLQQTVYDACPVAVLAYGADIQAIRRDAWTGYEDQLAGSGLFRVGNIAVYMNLEPRAAEAG